LKYEQADISSPGFWGFGTLAMLMIFYNIAVEGMKYATLLHKHYDGHYTTRGIKNGIKNTYMMCGFWYVSKAASTRLI